MLPVISATTVDNFFLAVGVGIAHLLLICLIMMELLRSFVVGMLCIIVWSVGGEGQVEVDVVTSSRAQPSSELTSAEIKDPRFILNSQNSGDDTVSTVLRLIESQRKNCSPGTELELEGSLKHDNFIYSSSVYSTFIF